MSDEELKYTMLNSSTHLKGLPRYSKKDTLRRRGPQREIAKALESYATRLAI